MLPNNPEMLIVGRPHTPIDFGFIHEGMKVFYNFLMLDMVINLLFLMFFLGLTLLCFVRYSKARRVLEFCVSFSSLCIFYCAIYLSASSLQDGSGIKHYAFIAVVAFAMFLIFRIFKFTPAMAERFAKIRSMMELHGCGIRAAADMLKEVESHDVAVENREYKKAV